MINLIPMAGRGARFIEKNYKNPKPFIPIINEPMILASLRSFPISDRYVFVCLHEHYDLLKSVTKKIKTSVDILFIDSVTQGQASTCLLAEKLIDRRETLFIASCDYQMVYNKNAYDLLLKDSTIDVIVWTFKIGAIKKADPKAFAYCKISNGQVVQVVEKSTISDSPENDSAVVGSFTYKNADLFFQSAKKMIEKNIRVNGEFYVGTSINQLIEQGYKVVSFEIEQFISFGNPFELETFNYWYKYFSETGNLLGQK